MTPEREYLLVTEFFDDAEEIGEAEVDDDIIDQGLRIVRQLWDAGLAHRDIKPANLLVQHGEVRLIDVFFVQVRPSPWRQAVDLANMMLVLAVRSDAQRVYERALRYFTPDEIAEAFAATRGAASPTQLRTVMKQDRRDLLGSSADGTGATPISLQRWNIKRVLLTLALLFGVFLAISPPTSSVPGTAEAGTGGADCGTTDAMILMAQAVPSASRCPVSLDSCRRLDAGRSQVERGGASFALDWIRAGKKAVVVTLRSRGDCATASAAEVPSDEPEMRRFERPERLPPNVRTVRTYLFPGGCVTYRVELSPEDRRLAAVRHRHGPRVPAPNRAGRRRSAPQRTPAVRCRRRVRTRMSGATAILADASVIVLLRVVAAVAIAVRRPSSRCDSSASGAAGARRCSPASSAGVVRAPSRSP